MKKRYALAYLLGFFTAIGALIAFLNVDFIEAEGEATRSRVHAV